jgi:PAS domain S-box-containing protein
LHGEAPVATSEIAFRITPSCISVMHNTLFSAHRISAIRRSGLLDRAGAAQFAHLTELVRTMLDVPVAIISIVDEDRQVFAGHCGLPEPWASRGETPMTHSFCQHVVAEDRPLIVRDANLHDLVMENHAIVDLGVIAYLGVPIRLPTGELVGALAAIHTQPRDWSDRDRKSLESLATVVEKEIALGVSELKYRSLFNDMQDGYYVARAFRNEQGALIDVVFEDVNPSFERLTGLSSDAVIGAPLSKIAPQSLEDMLAAFTHVLATGEVLLHANSSAVLGGRWCENRIRRLDGDRIAAILTDITDRKRAEAEQQLINKEMGHRLKNMLAMVQAIANQTLKKVTERDHVEAFEKRLQALSSAHDVMLDQNKDQAPVRSIIENTLQRLAPSERTHLDGADTIVGPKGALSLALLLHELGTNAVKYGALSNEAGVVAITWRIDTTDGEEHFHLSWTESGGPPVSSPVGKGFGSKLIRMGLIGTGGVRVDYHPAGFMAEMTAPLTQLQHAE